jgi:hypothetical protein
MAWFPLDRESRDQLVLALLPAAGGGDGDGDGDALGDAAAGVPDPLAVAGLEDSAATGADASPARFFLPSFLKSVSYHPAPFSRNAAALILRRNCGSPHCGQTLSGASESFCRFSVSALQLWQRYS